jgi:hypothetical protein
LSQKDVYMTVMFMVLMSSSIILLSYIDPHNFLIQWVEAQPLFQSVNAVVALITIVNLPLAAMLGYAWKRVEAVAEELSG